MDRCLCGARKSEKTIACLECWRRYKKYLAEAIVKFVDQKMIDGYKKEDRDKLRSYIWRARRRYEFSEKTFQFICQALDLDECVVVLCLDEEKIEFIHKFWEAQANFLEGGDEENEEVKSKL